jgi:23S rRNA (guanine745-N1)-methyltransferase
MIDGALPYLRCPVCERALSRTDRVLRCAAGHGFDLAKQGYANLSNGRVPYPGDTPEMVTDRESFLAAGHYAFIADALASYASSGRPASWANNGRPASRANNDGPASRANNDGLVVDAGTGTGYYLARVLEAAPESTGLGLDVSKAALRRAARAHPRAAAVLADLWRPLPIRDESAGLLLDVFAPRNGAEFHRVLRPDGVLLVVTPAPDHLTELIEAHGLIHVDPDKTARVAESLGAYFTEIESRVLRHRMELTGPEVRTLIGMTPNAHHVPAATRPEEASRVTAAVTVTAYRKAA